MQVEVNGTRLWFDVDGPALVPNGTRMRERPTVVLVHGGPASYDHSYLKPYFSQFAAEMQVVYLDLRNHGRSARHTPEDWSFELCADDLVAFCETVGIVAPIVLGHSMGGMVTMLYGTRHPGHARALILQSTMARFDLVRLADGFRRFAGDEVAELARREFGGDPVTDAQWAQVYVAYGPHVPSHDELARRVQNPELGEIGMQLLGSFDAVDQLGRITCPTLVCTGELDAVTPIDAAQEIFAALPTQARRYEVIEGAGHFPWLDAPDRYFSTINDFVTTTT